LKYRLQPSERARKLAESLSFREALNEISCPLLNFQPQEGYGAVHISHGPKEMVAARVTQIKLLCKRPPFVTCDLECGPGGVVKGFTTFPDLMALGSTDSEELAYEVGRVTALEGRSVGLNWSFAPCVDIATNPDSPVVSTRSAGCTPERVIATARGYLRGLQDHGFMATLKHFPGDGYSTYDQHLTTVVNPLSMSEWREGPGRVYRELIEAGAKTVMVGHISLPAYDDVDSQRGLYPPATLSKKLKVDLLRGELGFEGLIVSDAMGMGGVAGFRNVYEAYAVFLETGGDCILFPRVDEEKYYQEMRRFVEEGLLKESTVRDRAARMIAAKEDMGLFEEMPFHSPIAWDRHRILAQKVVDESVTLVRDRQKTLPFRLTPQSRVLHVILSPQAHQDRMIYESLTRALAARCGTVDEKADPGPQQLFHWASDGKYDLIVCSIGFGHSWAVSVARMHGPICRNLMEGWMRMGTPVVFVSHFHPFIHREYEAPMDCVINTFRSLEITGERVVKGITGEMPFCGKFEGIPPSHVR